jgi:hypothetical protein
MSVPATVPARLSSLPDDVLRALATFVPLSDLLVLVRCSRHIRVVLQKQLNHCLDRLFVVTHLEENWARARRLRFLYGSRALPNQPKQTVLDKLFGEADIRDGGNSRGYCFTDGQRLLCLSQHKDFLNENEDGYSLYYIITRKNKPIRDRFASWLRYRCDQQMATEAHGNSIDVIGGVTSDL